MPPLSPICTLVGVVMALLLVACILTLAVNSGHAVETLRAMWDLF